MRSRRRAVLHRPFKAGPGRGRGAVGAVYGIQRSGATGRTHCRAAVAPSRCRTGFRASLEGQSRGPRSRWERMPPGLRADRCRSSAVLVRHSTMLPHELGSILRFAQRRPRPRSALRATLTRLFCSAGLGSRMARGALARRSRRAYALHRGRPWKRPTVPTPLPVSSGQPEVPVQGKGRSAVRVVARAVEGREFLR